MYTPFIFAPFFLGTWGDPLPSPSVQAHSVAPACFEESMVSFTAKSNDLWSSKVVVPAGITAFVDVAVIPMDTNRVLMHQTVLVENGRITALGPSGKIVVPPGALRIDGRGQYLMPGLADFHAHFWEVNEEVTYDDSATLYYSGAGETPAQRAHRLASYVAHGITTVRNINSNLKAEWLNRQERIRGPILATKYLRPHIYFSGLYFYDHTIQGLSLDSVVAYVTAYKAAGYDFINITTQLANARRTLPVADSFLSTVRKSGIPVASHGHTRSFAEMLALGSVGGAYEHLAALVDTLKVIQQTTDSPATAMQIIAAATRRAGVWITPTLDCVQKKEPGPAVLWPMVKALQDADVGLLLGADSDSRSKMSPSRVYEELTALVNAGLNPYQALLTGTRNVAQYFGTLEQTGTIAIGKQADLVLLAGNPLMNIQTVREPSGVMINGQWFDRIALDQQLLASPKSWLLGEIVGGFAPELLGDQLLGVWGHVKQFRVLIDTLEKTPSTDRLASERILQRLTAELTGMRGLLTPEQQVAFDPKARVWLREQTRKGYTVAIPGLSLVR